VMSSKREIVGLSPVLGVILGAILLYLKINLLRISFIAIVSVA
jgi:hypothetical protein